jgi:hypothetical protein
MTLALAAAKKVSLSDAKRLLNSRLVLPKNIREALLNQVYINSVNNLLNLQKYNLNLTGKYKMFKNLYPDALKKLKPRDAESLLRVSPGLRRNANLLRIANKTNFRNIKGITNKEKMLLKARNQFKALKTRNGRTYKMTQFTYSNNSDDPNGSQPWWNHERMSRFYKRSQLKRSHLNKFPENFVYGNMFSKKNNRTVLNTYRKTLKNQTLRQRIKHGLFGY